MSSHRRTVALAAGIAIVSMTSWASAQDTPPPPQGEPPYDTPPAKNDATDLPGGQTPGTYHEGTYDTTAHPPPSGHASTTQTTSAEYNEMVSAERERTYQPNRPLLITGGALFVAPYVAGVIVASQSNLDADKRNYIPVVGPWLDLGQRPCAFGSACTTTDNVGSAFLIGSGVAQGVGIVLSVLSLALPETTKTSGPLEPKASMQMTPVSFAGGGGLGAIGTF